MTRLPDDTAARMLRLRRQGLTWPQIAARFGCTRETARRAVERAEVEEMGEKTGQ